MISIEVVGDSAQTLSELIGRVDSIDSSGSVMDDVGDILVNLIRTQLRSGHTPWGEKFAPLATLTVNTRFRGGKRYTKSGGQTARFSRHMGGNHVPLNDTGKHIADRITSARTTAGVVVGMLDSESNKIGRVHQFGAIIRAKRVKFLAIPVGDGSFRFKKSVKIPARPFMPIRGTKADLPTPWVNEIVERLRAALEV